MPSLTGLLITYSVIVLVVIGCLALAMSRRMSTDLLARLIIGATIALLPVALAGGLVLGDQLRSVTQSGPDTSQRHSVAIAVPAPTATATVATESTSTAEPDAALNQASTNPKQGAPDPALDLDDALSNPEIRAVFDRTDRPIINGDVDRAWAWGPAAITAPIQEPFSGVPGDQRTVQYFDQGRIEVTDTGTAVDDGWPLTTGLLVNEMVSGQIQIGVTEFETRSPADIPILGTELTPDGPTYAMLASLRDDRSMRIGSAINTILDPNGNLLTASRLADMRITISQIDALTEHGIAEPFWRYMNASGPIWIDGEERDGRLFTDAYFATGHAVTEPFWVHTQDPARPDVLVQCFERRCLIYAPVTEATWSVSSNYAGRHYYQWRYSEGTPGTG